MSRSARAGGRDAEQTYRALVSAALSLFEAHGYRGTSVQRIVDAAGMTKGAFYHHFDSKEDVLRELHDEFVDHHLERARGVVGRELPLEDRLRLFVREVLTEVVVRYQRETAIFHQEQRFLSEDAFGPIRRKRDEFERTLVELIERGIACGAFEPVGPPRLIAFAIIGMCGWSYTWFDPDGGVSAREIGELYAEILVGGLRPRSVDKPTGRY